MLRKRGIVLEKSWLEEDRADLTRTKMKLECRLNAVNTELKIIDSMMLEGEQDASNNAPE